jgi:hypothetical protein
MRLEYNEWAQFALQLSGALIGAGVLGMIYSPRWKRLAGGWLISLARYQELMRGYRSTAWQEAEKQRRTVGEIAAGCVVVTYPPAPDVLPEPAEEGAEWKDRNVKDWRTDRTASEQAG